MQYIKLLMLLLGVTFIFGSLITFVQNNYYPFYLYWVSFGLILFISGYYADVQKIKDKMINVFFGVNIFQWAIVLYIYFFNSVYINFDFYYMILLSVLFTIGIIAYFYNIPFFSYKEHKKGSRENIGNNLTFTWKQTALVVLGVIVSFVCLISYLVFNYLLILYFSLFGVMMIIYGYYLEINKIHMSFKYFILMISVIVAQIILVWSSWKFDNIINSDEREFIQYITVSIGVYLLWQILNSDMKYFGMYRKKSNGGRV